MSTFLAVLVGHQAPGHREGRARGPDQREAVPKSAVLCEIQILLLLVVLVVVAAASVPGTSGRGSAGLKMGRTRPKKGVEPLAELLVVALCRCWLPAVLHSAGVFELTGPVDTSTSPPARNV